MKKLNRRDALRAGSLFTLGTFANFEKLWSNSVNDANLNKNKFIFQNCAFEMAW